MVTLMKSPTTVKASIATRTEKTYILYFDDRALREMLNIAFAKDNIPAIPITAQIFVKCRYSGVTDIDGDTPLMVQWSEASASND